MNGRDFLLVASDLLSGLRESDWRSAVSRAYYGGFHAARDFLVAAGFSVPSTDGTHAYLWRRLANSGHPDIIVLGNAMIQFRGTRNWADYDVDRELEQHTAVDVVQAIDDLAKRFDELNSLPQVRTTIIDTIKVYEQKVLRENTWKQP